MVSHVFIVCWFSLSFSISMRKFKYFGTNIVSFVFILFYLLCSYEGLEFLNTFSMDTIYTYKAIRTEFPFFLLLGLISISKWICFGNCRLHTLSPLRDRLNVCIFWYSVFLWVQVSSLRWRLHHLLANFIAVLFLLARRYIARRIFRSTILLNFSCTECRKIFIRLFFWTMRRNGCWRSCDPRLWTCLLANRSRTSFFVLAN